MPNYQLPTSVGIELEVNNLTSNINDDVALVKRTMEQRVADFSSVEGRPLQWVIKQDGSCGTSSGPGVEVNSGVFLDSGNLEKSVRAMCKLLSDLHFTANHRCGFHVHIGVTQLNRAQTAKFAKFLARHEAAFYMLDPTRQSVSYCAPLTEPIMQGINHGDGWGAWTGRYHWINGQSYPSHGTLEFRLMTGTIDPEQVLGWVAFILHTYQEIAAPDCRSVGGPIQQVPLTGQHIRIFETLLDEVGLSKKSTELTNPLSVAARKWAASRFNALNTSNIIDQIRTERRRRRLAAWQGIELYKPIFNDEAILSSVIQDA